MSGECNREWFTPNQSRYPGHPGMWDQRESETTTEENSNG